MIFIWAANAQRPSAEVFDGNHALFNGKVQRFFNLKEFESTFGKPDLSSLLVDEQPCTYIFERQDGSKDLQDKYLYKGKTRFENSGDSVAVDYFTFPLSSLAYIKKAKLSQQTSLKELEKLFPIAVKYAEIVDFEEEGKLVMLTPNEDEPALSEVEIRIYLKENRLYFINWWFPC